MSVTYIMIPEEYWDVATGAVDVYRNNWWEYVEGKGIVVARIGKHRAIAPQCNTNRQITEMLIRKGYGPEGVEAKQIPLVMLPTSAWSSDLGSPYIPNAWTNVTTENPKQPPPHRLAGLTQALVPKED